MIARKEWFGRRKYTGWGVTPKTWQGWVYIASAVAILVGAQSLVSADEQTEVMITLVWTILLLVDVFPLMFSIKKDEREVQVEAISERNAAWFMVLVLTIGMLYDCINAALTKNIAEVNWFIAIALLGGAVIKSVSNYVLERE